MGEATFGKYRLIAELGHGGMADVFLAVIAGPVGSGFTKLTVVKRLRQNLAEEQEFVEMLVDEARISARLNHPNVVQTNEVGSVGNQYFLAMEYLDGQPLHRVQHRAMQKLARTQAEGATNPPPASDPNAFLQVDPFPKDCQYLVIVDTLAGLHHAHELADYDGTPLGIVHRDVTPHNVFVTYEGQVKVVDFGIAKAAGRASETRQGVVKGKVRYMAPEQAVGQAVDRRADLFSVGIMLWEAATGRRFWKDMDDLTIVQALVSGNMKISPREIDPNVPEAVDRICQKALAFNRDDRYATAEDFRTDLEDYLSSADVLTGARRRLSACVSELFKDKRVEIKRVIEKQLAKLRDQPPTESSPDLKPVMIALESGSSGTFQAPPATHSMPVQGEEGPTSITDAATELYTASKKKPGPGRLPALAIAAVLGVAVAGVAVVKIGVGSPKLPARSAAEDFIHVSIITNPQNAAVTVDGTPLWPPSNAKVPRDKRPHMLRIEAPGFDTEQAPVSFESDLTMTFNLRPSPSATTTVSSVTTAAPTTQPPKQTANVKPTFVPGPAKGATNANAGGKAEPSPGPTTAPPPTSESTANKQPPKIKLDDKIWDNN
jgi:serine/threonine-protein kinase